MFENDKIVYMCSLNGKFWNQFGAKLLYMCEEILLQVFITDYGCGVELLVPVPAV